MSRFFKIYGFVSFIVLLLIANGIVSLFELMPPWWRSGYYTLSPWTGASLSFGMALSVVCLGVYGHIRHRGTS